MFGVAAEKQREMTVRKAMDPQQHDDTRRSNPFSFRTNKALTEALDALFVTIA
jgi:hypothetical protein